ncbi:hypothetical protein [Maritimibacter sp. DP1N21-5]|uniref:hypothetical protein n=1 Tax=Maritimibacter sp. DP1N21-5 TaxID=2836867 RepID=UPI001C486644|nr:hypothetical protein [Maritimibacter sp. DP1N21-5]MBV7410325.1 hypothetical protein [Maritimibacter sp. DP1N21-5]
MELNPSEVWQNNLKDVADKGRAPTFSEMVWLAKVAPHLKFAFENDLHISYRSTVKRAAQGIAVTHGHNPTDIPPEYQPTDRTFNGLVEAALEDRFWFDALRYAIATLIENDIPLCEQFAFFIADVLQDKVEIPSKRRGPDPFPIRERDFWIIQFLKDIEKLGGRITENEATFTENTACHAILEAWEGTPDLPTAKTLMNIWSRRSDI